MNAVTILLLSLSLILLFLCSAFFSGSETALMSVNRLRLKHLKEKDAKKVEIVETILKRSDRLIGAILLGNNLVNVAMSAIATALAITLLGDIGIAYVTGILTFLILVFAEITPKVYAQTFNERVSLLIARPIQYIMTIFNPIVIALTFISGRILLLLGVNTAAKKRPLLTEDELRTYIKISTEDQSITREEKHMLSRIFTLNDKSVRDIMIPEDKMTVLNIDQPTDKIMKFLLQKGYSRYPVTKGKDDNIIGFIHSKDLLKYTGQKKAIQFKKIIRPPYFIPEDKKIDAQLRSFKARRLHQAVVLNGAGEVAGLLTLEDILEEIVGSIRDEHDP